MKTTAEEKLLASLEDLVDQAAIEMSASELRKALKSNHKLAQDVISRHRRMVEVWTAMDKRMQARGKKVH